MKISKNKKVLVTGGTGFIGSHLSNKLYDLGYHVIISGCETEQNPKFHKMLHLNLNGIDFKELGEIDICFHQAANNNTRDLNENAMLESNVHSPIKLFKYLVEKCNCKKFIYASSGSVYGNSMTPFIENYTKINPLNPYAKSKAIFDNYMFKNFIKKYPASVIGLRYTNVYGLNEGHKKNRASMIYQMLNKILNNEHVLLFNNGEQKRDWVYINDAVNMNIAAIDYEKSNIFNCGSGESVTFNFIAKSLQILTGKEVKIKYVNCAFAEKFQKSTLADMSKAKNELNFTPQFRILKGLGDLVNQIKNPPKFCLDGL